MKTKKLWALALGCGLAAFQSWADSVPTTNLGLLADNEDYATVDGSGAFGQSASWTATGSSLWSSLDRDDYSPAIALATTIDLPQTAPVGANRVLERKSDDVASFILIGLGGALLLGYRWKMSHAPESAPGTAG